MKNSTRQVPRRQWTEFKLLIQEIDSSSLPQVIFLEIVNWLRKYPEMIASEPFKLYKFEKYLELDQAEYPIAESSLRGGELKRLKERIIKKIKPSSLPGILAKIMEDLVVIEVDDECPNCAGGGLAVYFDKGAECLAYECRQCGFAKHPDGSSVSENSLVLACNNNLRSAGLI